MPDPSETETTQAPQQIEVATEKPQPAAEQQNLSLDAEFPQSGAEGVNIAVDEHPLPPENADRQVKIDALNESARQLVMGNNENPNLDVFAANVEKKLPGFVKNEENREKPLVDIVHERAKREGNPPNQEQMNQAVGQYSEALDEFVNEQIAGRGLNVALLKEFGFTDEDIKAAGDELTPADIKKHIREGVKFDEFSAFLYDKMAGEKTEEIKKAVEEDAEASEELAVLEGLPEEEKKSKLRSIISKLGSEAEYQFFENKQNNLDAFLDAFFDVNWRDRSGYGSYDRVDKNKEKSGHQIGAQTIKESIGGETQSMDALISLQKAVIAELGAEGPFAAADYKKILAMGNEEFRTYITSKDGTDAWLQAFNGAHKGKALGRLSAWVSGSSGDNEYRASKSMLEVSKKAALQQNLPKDGNFGMTQEALAYLFTR